MKKRLVTFLSSYEEMNLNSFNSVSPNDGTIDDDDSTLKQIIKESYRVSISDHEQERDRERERERDINRIVFSSA